MTSKSNNYFPSDSLVTQVGRSILTSLGEDNMKVKLKTSIDLHPCNIKTRDRGKKKGYQFYKGNDFEWKRVKEVLKNKKEGGPTKEAIVDVVSEGKKVAIPEQLNVPFHQRPKDEKNKEFTRQSIPKRVSRNRKAWQ
ncbi:hypothetical protein CR513_16416, partial [Mucuna pruriens]